MIQSIGCMKMIYQKVLLKVKIEVFKEKNKQIYINLLAQQCVTKDVFSMESKYENLTDSFL